MSRLLKSIWVETHDETKRQRSGCFLPGQMEEERGLHSQLAVTCASAVLDSVISWGKRVFRCSQVVTVWVCPVLPFLSPRMTFSLFNMCEDFSEAKTRPDLSYVKGKFQTRKSLYLFMHCSWVLRTCVFYQQGSEMWNRSFLDLWGCWMGTIAHSGSVM